MSRWSDLPPELLKLITQKQTNYVDYLSIRSVCRPWRSALLKRPLDLLCQLPWLLIPYQKDSPNCRGFHNLADGKTYTLELSEAYEKRCCGSSHGWLVMVEESPTIFLLNPLTKARIELPSLSTLPNFPITGMFSKNSWNLVPSYFWPSKQRVRDRFIRKAIVSADPSLVSNFTVMIIYALNESLAFCSPGETAWTAVEKNSSPAKYKDIMFHSGNLYAVDETGRVSICNSDPPATLVHFADPQPIPPKVGYKQWYLASLNEHLSLVGRFRKYDVVDYPYHTRKFVAYKLETSESNWSEVESLEDRILFLGSSFSHSVSAMKFPNCRRNCIYFTDDSSLVCSDFKWEGHGFGIFNIHDGRVQRIGLPPLYQIKQPSGPCISHCQRSLKRNRSVHLLPPPIWVTISP